VAIVPSNYLQASDLAPYGIPSATAAQVAQASRLVDVITRRPRSGFVWVPDAAGRPCYMATATPELTFTAGAPVAPGSNVVVPVQSTPLNPELIGTPLVLDRATPAVLEAAVVVAVNTGTVGNLTLDRVAYAHASGALLESGMQVFEERFLPDARSLARVAQWPVVDVRSAYGRYSYGRRSQQIQGNFSEFNLLAILQNFGGPPAWIPVDVTQLGINRLTGEMWVPAGVLLAYYSDFRVHYVAGWSQANLPAVIKQATANIVQNAILGAGSSSMFRMMKAGETALERFADTAVDDGTRRMLKAFEANGFI
jgi:hypothetical protein